MTLIAGQCDLTQIQSYQLLLLLGYLYLAQDDFAQARQTYETYLTKARTENNWEEIHIGLHQLAMVYRDQGDWARALDLIAEERTVIDQHFAGDWLKQSVNDYEQGYLRLKLKQLTEAGVYMQRSLRAAYQTDDLIAQACSERGCGEIAVAQGDVATAQGHYERAQALFLKADDAVGAQEVADLLHLMNQK